jgi:hypothetical protein
MTDIDSQEEPDTEPAVIADGIVPRYMLRRIEAMRRYPVEDGDYPGVDRNAAARQGFIDGAEWEAEAHPGPEWGLEDAGHP